MTDSSGDNLRVYAATHPLRAGRECHVVSAGSSVQQIVEQVAPDPWMRSHFVVNVGGRIVPREYWRYVRPHANTSVAIRAVPLGGDGDKDPLRAILMVVVTVVSYVYAPGLANTVFGSTSRAAVAVAGAAINITGRLLVDAIAPPPTPEELGGGGIDKDQARPSIENARNRPARYQPIPRPYGTVRFVPPYSVLPYTEIRGNDQYLHFAVCWGYGPLDIGQIRIGNTDISNFDEYEISHDSGDGVWSNGQIISADVSERGLSVVLNESDGFTTRTTDVDTDEISVDISFPRGLVEITNSGDKKRRTVLTRIEYSPAGQNSWKSAIDTDGTVGPFTLSTPSYSRAARMGPTALVKNVVHSVYLDPANNTVGSTVGNPQTYTVTGRGGSIVLQSGHTVSSVPVGTVKLAEVTTEKRGVNDKGIVSITNTARGDAFGSINDFIVSQDTANSVAISDGTYAPDGGFLRTSASSTSTVRNTYKFKVAKGQYDVRLKRATADSSDDSIRDQLVWSAFRSINHTEPVDTDFASSISLAQTQIIIKATDQLNGVIDQLNGVVSSILPDYNSGNGTWEEVTTSNPASIYRDILQGNANEEPIPDSRVDLSTLEYFHGRSATKDFYYNDVIQGGSVQDALKQVLAPARASHTIIDGVHSLVIDEEKTDVVQHFTPRNSKNFSGTKRFAKQPHAIKVPFNNREIGYKQDEAIAYDDGFSADGTNCEFLDENGQCNAATEFERVDIKGITDGEQAWRYGRYTLATNKLRPENYTLDVDFEHLVATRGDLVRVTHDVPLFGLGSGRVKSIDLDSSGTNAVGVTLDEELELAANTVYVLRFRLDNGDTLVRELEQVGSDTATHSVDFVNPVAVADGPTAGNLAQFGQQNEESIECIIKEITADGPDWGATLVLVDHAQPAIDNAADSSIPAFETNITTNPFEQDHPAAPQVKDVVADERALVREQDGTVSAAIFVDFNVPSSAKKATNSVQARWRKRDETGAWQTRTVSSQEHGVSLLPVDTGKTYEVQMRTVSEFGPTSPWVVADDAITVEGKTNPPSDVTGFTVNAARDRLEFEWNENPELDVVRYEIREGSVWADGTRIAITDATKHQTRNVSNGPWMIKAIDSLKQKSVNETSASISVTLPTVNSFRAQVIDNTALLRWESSPGTFDLATHEIRRGDAFATAEVVGTSDKTFDNISELEGGEKRYWVAPVDEAGNLGPEEGLTATVDDPPDFELRDQFQTDWQGFSVSGLTPIEQTSADFRRNVRDFTGIEFDGVDDYAALDESYASAQTDATFEAWVQTFADGIIASWDDSEYFRVRVAGGVASVAYTDSVNGASTLTGTTKASDGRWHHIAFVYAGSVEARLYVDGVEEAVNMLSSASQLGTGATRYGMLGVGSEAASFNGSKGPLNWFSGRMTEIRRWTVARTAAEISAWKDRTLDGTETGLASYYRAQETRTVQAPPVLTNSSVNGNDGQLQGATRYTPRVKAITPHDDLSRDELDALGFASRDDMIASGYDYRAQPTPVTDSTGPAGRYVEIYDAGVEIPSTSIQVTLGRTDIVGSVTPTVTISTKRNAGDPWEDFAAGLSQVFATQFRWVKVSIDFDNSADTDFTRLETLDTVLKTKLKDDSGTVNVASNPTTVSFNINYIDVASITATPAGDTSLLAVVDFADVADPTGFDIYLFDNSGNPATGDVRWYARGI